MRFEELTRNAQLDTLCNLHDLLNDGLFNGSLKRAAHVPPIEELCDNDVYTLPIDTIRIAIAHAGKSINYCARAHFEGHNVLSDEAIVFDYIDIKYNIATYNDKQQQINELATIMLHEMIHQYIHEEGIKDNSPHGRAFKRECKKHGLIRTPYLNDDCQWEHEEKLSAEAQDVIKGFCF